MRVLLFNLATDADDPILGFASRWVRAIAARVERVDVVTMRAGRLDLPSNVTVRSVGKERGLSEPRRALELYRHLLTVLREPVDVCFSHMIPIFSVMAAPLLRARGIPLVTWYAHRQVTPVLKLAHHLSTRLVTSAPSSYRYRHDKLAVLGQGIDASMFEPVPPAPDGVPLLVSVARISPIKDPMTLVEAVDLLVRRGREVRCAFVGDAPARDADYEAAVRRRAGPLEEAGSVSFVGPVQSDRVVEWLRKSSAHVNLCPTGAIDKAAIEAMICQRPSLVANVGFRETLGDWSDQLIFRHGDPSDLAARVEALLAMSAVERARIGADLRERALARHSLDGLADRLVALLREVARA
jgi:glycosyltransferase involved in cell wall biosynthesis